MYNGYTPTTEYEQIKSKADRARVELIEAMGGDMDEYMKWANTLAVSDHLDRRAFLAQCELKLNEIETEAGEIIGNHFRRKQNMALFDVNCDIEQMKADRQTNDNGVAPQHTTPPMPYEFDGELDF